jgi:hypothetical protein
LRNSFCLASCEIYRFGFHLFIRIIILHIVAGEYVGLTGARLDGAEMLLCGLATHLVPSAVFPLCTEIIKCICSKIEEQSENIMLARGDNICNMFLFMYQLMTWMLQFLLYCHGNISWHRHIMLAEPELI